MEKIDIHDTEKNYEYAIKKLLSDENIIQPNKLLIIKFLDASAIGKTASRKAKVKSVGLRGRLKNLYLLKTPAYYFDSKRLDKIKNKDMEKFIADLDSNKIKRNDGLKYSEQTKSNIKKCFIIFLRYYLGENSKEFIDMTSWIDTKYKKKTIDYFKENEILEILKKCNTIKQKVLVTCLYDGGFRIEEFSNIRNSDVQYIEGKVPFYRMRVRTEFSKTFGRDVPMLWRDSTETIKLWIESKEYKADEQFFPSTYDGIRMMLKNIGERTNTKITPHKLRRSSAFYYANQGHNDFQINKRYGWASGSDVGGKYYVEQSKIDLESKEEVKKFEELKFDELQEVLKRQEQDSKILHELNEELKNNQQKQDKKISILEKNNNEMLLVFNYIKSQVKIGKEILLEEQQQANEVDYTLKEMKKFHQKEDLENYKKIFEEQKQRNSERIKRIVELTK